MGEEFIFCGRAVDIAVRADGMPQFRVAGRLTVAFICFHILYVCVIANTCAYAENNRMRFTTDPFYVVLAALFVRQYLVGRPAGRPYPS